MSTSGEKLGTIDDVLFEQSIEPDSPPLNAADRTGVTIRYLLLRLVVAWLGSKPRGDSSCTCRHHQLVSDEIDSTRDELRQAPRFENLVPLSRQDEVMICNHFEVPDYWLSSQQADS